MTKVYFTSPHIYDGVRYEAGASAFVEDSSAEQLISNGYATRAIEQIDVVQSDDIE